MKMIKGAHYPEEVTAVQPTRDQSRKEIITVNGMTVNTADPVRGKNIIRTEEACVISMTNIITDGAGTMKEIMDIRDDQDMAMIGIQAAIKTDIVMTDMSAENLTMAANQIEIRTDRIMEAAGLEVNG